MKILWIYLAICALPYFANGQSTIQDRPVFARDNVNAVLWQQKSGEYRALAYQAYNLAQLRLAQSFAVPSKKPRCVIVDIDETILDNSAFEGYELHNGTSYNQNDWLLWTSKAIADTVPGALGFLKYAAKKGVAVFYITNRGNPELEATLKNLQIFKFPFADAKHVLVKDNTSDKESRRKQVAEKYNIVLLCGDNLNDFTGFFYLKPQDERNAAVDNMHNRFGKQFIVLPNPMYGDWEPPIYQYKKGLTEQEKADLRMGSLKDF